MTNQNDLGGSSNLAVKSGYAAAVVEIAGDPNTIFVKGDLDAPAYFELSMDVSNNRLIYCRIGNGLVSGPNQDIRFLSSGSAFVPKQNEHWQLQLGRGPQAWHITEWADHSRSIPDTKLESTMSFMLGNSSNALQDITSQISTLEGVMSDMPNLQIAWLNLIIHEMVDNSQSFSLTPPPTDQTAQINDLTDSIKENPQYDWSLTQGARVAGYSPFHLSRVFRSIVNMGFPEFVDRCRTEFAIKKILSGSETLNIIANLSGFGTPQAMRNAFREYAGFLPSEMRNIVTE